MRNQKRRPSNTDRDKKRSTHPIRLPVIAVAAFAAFVISVGLSGLLRDLLSNGVFQLNDDQTSAIASLTEGVIAALSAGIVVYQLGSGDELEAHQNEIEEERFIFQYNQVFLNDERLTAIENMLQGQLEAYENSKDKTTYKWDFGLYNSENVQAFVNYMVYLEGIAPLVLNNIVQLEHIDDLMAYRYFIAINNPVVQENSLKKFPEFYKGCFRLYKIWKQYRLENGSDTILPDCSLDKWEFFDEFAENVVIRGVLEQDDEDRIADYIYRSNSAVYQRTFGNRLFARYHIKKWMNARGSPCYKDNIILAIIDGTIVGVAVVLREIQQEIFNYTEYGKIHKLLPDQYEKTARELNQLWKDLQTNTNNGDGDGNGCICIFSVYVSRNHRRDHVGKILLGNIIRNYNKKKNIIFVPPEKNNNLEEQVLNNYKFSTRTIKSEKIVRIRYAEKNTDSDEQLIYHRTD